MVERPEGTQNRCLDPVPGPGAWTRCLDPVPGPGAWTRCLDPGYDNPTGHGAVADAGYQPHIRRIGAEKLDQSGTKTHPARRWVVERTLGWLSKCRAILVRYDKKPSHYLVCFNRLVHLSGTAVNGASLI